MGRTAPTAHGAAAAVEQRQINTVLVAYVYQGFLGTVLRPGSGQLTSIFGRVGVADHHFLAVFGQSAVAGQRQQLINHIPRVVQIVQGFEQRCNGQRDLPPHFLHQQRHGEHIRRLGGHGNNVSTQRFCMLLGDHLEGVDDLTGLRRTLPAAGYQRAARLKLRQQKLLTLGFAPLLVVA